MSFSFNATSLWVLKKLIVGSVGWLMNERMFGWVNRVLGVVRGRPSVDGLWGFPVHPDAAGRRSAPAGRPSALQGQCSHVRMQCVDGERETLWCEAALMQMFHDGVLREPLQDILLFVCTRRSVWVCDQFTVKSDIIHIRNTVNAVWVRWGEEVGLCQDWGCEDGCVRIPQYFLLLSVI